MDQSINSIFNLDKSSEVSEIPDSAVHACSDLITLVQRLPWVFLHLLHTQANAPRSWIHAEHFNLDQVAGVNYLARMLDALGPAHFGNMDQSFDATLEFHKGAVICNARDFSVHARSHRETLFDAGPRIG